MTIRCILSTATILITLSLSACATGSMVTVNCPNSFVAVTVAHSFLREVENRDVKNACRDTFVPLDKKERADSAAHNATDQAERAAAAAAKQEQADLAAKRLANLSVRSASLDTSCNAVNAIVATGDAPATEQVLRTIRAYDMVLDSTGHILVTGFLLGFASGAAEHRCRDTPGETLLQATTYCYNYMVQHPAFVAQLREYSATHLTGYWGPSPAVARVAGLAWISHARAGRDGERGHYRAF
jgi:hypothetical protein